VIVIAGDPAILGAGDIARGGGERVPFADASAARARLFRNGHHHGAARTGESMIVEAATGADVQYAGSDSFEQQIVIDAEAGSPPNIAVFPQPGLAADWPPSGFLAPLGDDMAAWVAENYAAGSPGSIWAPMRAPMGRANSTAFLQGRCEVAGLVRAREFRGCGL
jgi:hypothetical protein